MVRRLYVELGKDLPLVNSFGMAPDKLCSDNGRWHYSPSFRASWCPQDLDRGISGRNHARAFVHDVCRRLGLEPSGIEGALQNIMEMTAKWNAVLVKLVKDKRVRHLASAEGN